jgi:hypothetical protein
MVKNYELKNLWWRCFAFYSLSLLTTFSFILSTRLELAASLVKGLVYPIVKFDSIWSKRMIVQRSRKVSDEELFQRQILRKDVYPTILDVKRKASALFHQK